jgi:GMP synthase-like glutamine amidotransferase
MKPVLIRQHGEHSPPDLLEDWLRARSIPYVVNRSWLGEPLPDPRDHSFVVSLGSRFNPRDRDEPLVADELRLLDRAVEREVPVLGLCFGGQVLAAVLGAEIEPAPEPELGWYTLDSDDHDLIEPGPWLEWHYERFEVPAGAREIARTRVAPQAFTYGPHLGVQFHPESRAETVAGWARKDAQRLASYGIEDGVALLEGPAEQQQAAVEAAFRLFDEFLARTSSDGTSSKEQTVSGGERSDG